jgi:hypothetical protein
MRPYLLRQILHHVTDRWSTVFRSIRLKVCEFCWKPQDLNGHGQERRGRERCNNNGTRKADENGRSVHVWKEREVRDTLPSDAGPMRGGVLAAGALVCQWKQSHKTERVVGPQAHIHCVVSRILNFMMQCLYQDLFSTFGCMVFTLIACINCLSRALVC